ncbi:MAG: diguanylate cyclase [Spirochaetales bacterium]|nr:diguanylate cyclase [Spirochaetales bacterium]
MLRGFRRSRGRRGRSPLLPGKKRLIAASTVLALAIAVSLSASMEEARLAGAREKTRARVEAYASRLSFRLHAALHPALYVEGAASDGALPEAEFRAIADSALSDRRELLALAYSEGSIIRYVAPEGAAFPQPGLDLFRFGTSAAVATRSRFSSQASISAPFEDERGSTVFLALIPVEAKGNEESRGFVGFAAALIDLESVLVDAGLAALEDEGYDYRLVCLDGSGMRLAELAVSRGALARDPVGVKLLTEGGEWRLEAAPRSGWTDLRAHVAYAAVALALGAFAFALALAAARYLESEQRYRLIAEHARDVIWTASFPELRFTYLSPSFEQLTGYAVEEALGRSIVQALPGEAAERLRDALERRVPRAVMGDPAARSGRSEYLQRRKDGSEVWVGLETTFISDRYDRIRAVLGIARDIDERKRAELELARLATTDPLTGAVNRRLLFDEAARELARASRSGTPTGLVMVDLDHFKVMNDARGHQAGDRVLASVADALQSAVRAEDLVGRYGGEEFAVLLPGADLDHAMTLAERLRGLVESLRFEGGDGPYGITASFGAATLAPGGGNFDALVSAADAALYEAKREGRNRVRGAGRT